MGADLQDSSDGDAGPISAINVTPFVDVVLVLLVIFMLTAPALVKDSLGVKLPKAASAEKSAVDSLGIAVTKQGQIIINGELSSDDVLKEAVRLAVEKNPETQALISADIEAKHGDVVHVIDIVKTNGLTRFAIQIDRQ